MQSIKQYIWKVLLALDQLGNTILLGDPDETISSRLGKDAIAADCRFCMFMCKILAKFDNNYCRKAIEYDMRY